MKKIKEKNGGYHKKLSPALMRSNRRNQKPWRWRLSPPMMAMRIWWRRLRRNSKLRVGVSRRKRQRATPARCHKNPTTSTSNKTTTTLKMNKSTTKRSNALKQATSQEEGTSSLSSLKKPAMTLAKATSKESPRMKRRTNMRRKSSLWREDRKMKAFQLYWTGIARRHSTKGRRWYKLK